MSFQNEKKRLEKKFEERKLRKPKILLVNDIPYGEMATEILRCTLSPLIDYCSNLITAWDKDPESYDIAIIDASMDIPINIGRKTLSELLKLRNPNIVIVGTSIMGEYFDNDSISKQMYDERISSFVLTEPDEIDEIKMKLKKYGFEFPEGTSDFLDL